MTPIRLSILVVFVSLVSCGVARAQLKAQVPTATPAWNKGIQPISSESYYHAIECGKQGGEAPACVFYDNDLCKNADYTLSFYTPYKMVAYTVWQAVRKNQPPPKPSYSEAKSTRVILGVRPVRGSKNPIAAVNIKRGGKSLPPSTRTLDNGGGTFIFDFAAFAPTADITIELVGKAKTYTCLVARPVLARFR